MITKTDKSSSVVELDDILVENLTYHNLHDNKEEQRMSNYDYYEAVESDIKDYIEENYTPEELEAFDVDEFGEMLNETLWAEDSVTGNGSGSYTYNSERAKEYAVDNLDLYVDAEEEYGGDFRHLRDHDWEGVDVTIRCFILGECIDKVLNELF